LIRPYLLFMPMKITSLTICLLFLLGCTTIQHSNLQGFYQYSNEFYRHDMGLIFDEENTYSVDLDGDAKVDFIGTYQVVEDRLSVRGPIDSRAPECQHDGMYTYSIVDGNIEFKKLRDYCSERMQIFMLKWEKI